MRPSKRTRKDPLTIFSTLSQLSGRRVEIARRPETGETGSFRFVMERTGGPAGGWVVGLAGWLARRSFLVCDGSGLVLHRRGDVSSLEGDPRRAIGVDSNDGVDLPPISECRDAFVVDTSKTGVAVVCHSAQAPLAPQAPAAEVHGVASATEAGGPGAEETGQKDYGRIVDRVLSLKGCVWCSRGKIRLGCCWVAEELWSWICTLPSQAHRPRDCVGGAAAAICRGGSGIGSGFLC